MHTCLCFLEDKKDDDDQPGPILGAISRLAQTEMYHLGRIGKGKRKEDFFMTKKNRICFIICSILVGEEIGLRV